MTNNASEAANWLNNQLPAPGDIAILDGISGIPLFSNPNKPITFDAAFLGNLSQLRVLNTYTGVATMDRNLTVTDHIDLDGASINVNNGRTLDTYMLFANGGQLTGEGSVTILGAAGTPGQLSFNAANITYSVAQITINQNAEVDFNQKTTLDGTALTINGEGNWSNGDIVMNGGATITNNGQFSVYSNDKLRSVLAGPFTNNGTFTKYSAGLTTITTGFQTGPASTLNLNSGSIDFERSSTFTSPVNVAFGSTMYFGGAASTHTLGAGIIFQGQGTVEVLDGTMSVPVGNTANFLIPLVFDSGTFEGPGIVNTHASLRWSAGLIVGLPGFYVYESVVFDTAGTKELEGTDFYIYGSAVWQDTGAIQLDNAAIKNFGVFDIQNNAEMNLVGAAALSAFENLAVGSARGMVTKAIGDPVGAGTQIRVPFRTAGDLFVSFGGIIKFWEGVLQEDAGSVTDLNDGIIKLGLGTQYTISGGTFRGKGTIDGDLLNIAGMVQIGQAGSQDTLIVTGAYTQQAGGTIKFSTSGDNAWGKLEAGSANLAGAFAIELLDGFNPLPGYKKTVITTTGALQGSLTSPGGWGMDTTANSLEIERS